MQLFINKILAQHVQFSQITPHLLNTTYYIMTNKYNTTIVLELIIGTDCNLLSW